MNETIEYKGHKIELRPVSGGVKTLIDGRQTSARAYRGRALIKAKRLIDQGAV